MSSYPLGKQIEAILCNAGMAVIGFDSELSVVHWDQSAVQVFGLSADDMLGQPVSRMVDKNDQADFLRFIQACKTSSEASDLVVNCIDKQGYSRQMEIIVLQEADDSDSYTAVFKDICSQKEVSSAVEEFESRFKTLYENMPGGMLIIGQDYLIRDVNSRACEITGYTRDELIGQLCDTVCPKGSTSKKCPIWEEHQCEFSGMDTTIKIKNGTKKPILKNAKRIWMQGEEYILENFQDVSSLKEIQDALAVSEAKYRLLADNTLDTIWVMSMDLVFTYVNPSAETLSGYPTESIIGTHLSEFVDPEQFVILDKILAEIIRNREKDISQVFETSIRHKNGTNVPVEFICKVVLNEDGTLKHLQGTARDILERKELSKQLRQSQKMEAVGQLAGGIAHDFNNLLQVIRGYLELATEEMGRNHPSLVSLNEIGNACSRATRLVRKLLAFSKQQILKAQRLDLNYVINDLMDILRRTITERVSLEFKPCHDLGYVYADHSMIEQILLNLCLNAKDSISGEGKFTLETSNVTIDQEFTSRNHWAKPGKYVLVTATDTGSGMSSEIAGKAFEPFFSTKEVTKGSGLGLSMVYGLIAQHEGMVNLSSQLGVGTTVKMYLPRIEEHKSIKKKHPITDPPDKTIRILIAEDDPIVRKLTCMILEKEGYSVYPVSNGEEAVSVFQDNHQEFDLVILDMVMPLMSGTKAAEAIRKSDNSVKFIFMSGYSDIDGKNERILEENSVLVKKPYSRSHLLSLIRKTIGIQS